MWLPWRQGAGKRKLRRRLVKSSRMSFRPHVETLEDRRLLSGSSFTNEPIVGQMYQDLLQRPAEVAGQAFWSGLLDQGASRAQVALGIESSPEYRTKLVEGVYGELLARPADPPGLGAFVQFLAAGGAVEQLKVGVLASPEYFDRRAGGTSAGFLTVLYDDVLGRPIDPSGAAAYGSVLAPESFRGQPAMARAAVAWLVVNSPEGRQVLVRTVYRQLLHREPDDAGLAFWTGALQQGMRDEQMIAAIAGSEEYGARLPAPAVPDTLPPTVVIHSPGAGLVTNQNFAIIGRVTDDRSGVASLQAQVDAGASFDVGVDAAGGFRFDTALALDGSADGSHTVTLRAADRAGNVAAAAVSFTLDTTTPPDPGTVAPPVDPTVATSLAAATQFLYTGDNPIQVGVVEGTIEARRVAVLRGTVTDRDGAPLTGVAVTILDHPEFGFTRTRADGMFDLAVNGGGLLTVNYARDGFLSAQRQVQVPWEDYAWLPDVVLIPQDIQVTTIDLTASTAIQVAQGSPVTDADGTRQATVLFPQGTQATMTLPDGTTQALTTLHVRATEYTVGANGPAAMPAELPANSGYTYAVELSADEAVAAGATSVQFSQPVPFYVDNFLGFPVGGIVPAGYYDRVRGVWVASENGRVIKILSETGGAADLDTDGDGTADDAAILAALGVTEAEQQQLAALYEPGQGLWRVPIPHFTPWDHNWPFGPPDDATPPNQSLPRQNNPVPDPDRVPCNSVIACQNQTLGEAVAVAGTPFNLHYQSDRTPGHTSTLEIPLTSASFPASLRAVILEVEVAGRRFFEQFAPRANLTHTFTWDGKDAYGRTPQGSQPVGVRVGYVYGAVYQEPARFGRAFAAFADDVPISGSRAREEITIWQEWEGHIGAWDVRGQGLGGWTLDVQHAYDVAGRVLHRGDGRSGNAVDVTKVITTVAGNGIRGFEGDGGPAIQAQFANLEKVAVGPDGSLYIADWGNQRIRRVGPDGIITTVAGSGDVDAVAGGVRPGFSGDGGPATQAKLAFPFSVAVGPDGSLYIADANNRRIRLVGPDGIITTVAGNGLVGFEGDGGPAIQAQLELPGDVAVGPDGSLYIADFGNHRIRRVGPDGIITTVAGDGTDGYGGDGGPATAAQLSSPRDVAVGPDGSLYIADTSNRRIRRVGPDGIITTVAGNGLLGSEGDGGPAIQARLAIPSAVAVGPDGSLYIADSGNFHRRIRLVGPDGIITTVAGNGLNGFEGDGGPATAARINADGVAVGPDGSLYIVEHGNHRIRQVTPPLPGFSAGDITIPAEDGSEVYIFNSAGRHLRTLDALTGAVRYHFSYDGAGLLTAVTDGNGNVTTIERDATGKPTAVVAPFGQRTALELDANGYLARIANPAGEAVQLGSTADGLLTSLADPRGGVHRFSYDDLGRLTRDENPAGGFTILDRRDTGSSYTVTLTTAEGEVATYRVDDIPTGGQRRVNTLPGGLQTVTEIGTDGTRTTTAPDGTVTQITFGPDPRFGMQAPLIVSASVTTPGGLTFTLSASRTVTLSDPNNPLSLAVQTDTATVNGRTYTTTFDAAAQTITSTTPEGRTSVTSLDEKGRVTGVHVPGLDDVEFSYDSRGRLAMVGQGSRSSTLTYDGEGNLATVTDPLSHTVTLTYDPAGRVEEQTLPDGRVIRFNYDASGNVETITPPGRPAHGFTYTPADLTQDYTPPAVGAGATGTHYTYDLDKQLLQAVRPDGATIELGYDEAGRLSTVAHSQGSVGLAYHPTTGNVTTVTGPGGVTLTYAHNGGLPTGTTWSGAVSGNVHRAFDGNFRLTSEVVNGGHTVAFGYDDDGLLTQVGDRTLSRDPLNGRLTGSALGTVTDTLSFNSFGEPVGYQANAGGTTLFSVLDTPDALGRIQQRTETIGGVPHTYVYTYDPAGRLTDVEKDGVPVSQYGYDANGNRLSHTSASGTTVGTYDDQDRLLTYGTLTYTYTANGELRTKTDTATNETTTYSYDALGNLLAVTLPDGTQLEYLVDGQDRRIGKKVNGVLMQGFLYRDGLAPVAELDGAGNVVSRFVYAGGGNVPEYMVKGGVTYRIITDHLGSVRLAVNAATGEVVQRMDYDEFGNVTLDTNPGFQPFGFAGGLYDRDTRLVRFGARDYDALTGRWTAKDPIRFAGKQANLYAYVGSDPVNLIDPDGLEGVGWGFGLSLDLSWVQPFTSGGGGSAGVNLQFLSKGPHRGLSLFTYVPTSDPSTGLSIGVSCQPNITWGNGEWTGVFENYGAGVLKWGGSFFESPGASETGQGWQGVAFSFGAGPSPVNVSANQTNYSEFEGPQGSSGPYTGVQEARWGGRY